MGKRFHLGFAVSTGYYPLSGASGIVYGSDLTFTALAPPAVTTLAATSITTNSATLNGNLTSLGTSSLVYVRLCWGINNSNGTEFESAVQVKTSTGAFSAAISNLLPNTTYRFKPSANGSGMIRWGDTMTFSTPP